VLKAYFDASGSARDPGISVLSVSGYIAHEDQWADFEKVWPTVLKEFGIAEFHMSHFAQCEGEFAKWKDKKWEPTRQAFIKAISTAINDHTHRSVGITVDLHTYDWFNERFRIEETLGTPYGMAALSAIMLTMEWRESSKLREPLLFFFEKGDNEQADFRKQLAALKLPVDPVFCKKRWTDDQGDIHYCLPFQASDFIAYEHAKTTLDCIRDGKIDMRHSARAIVRPDDDGRWAGVNRHVLWKFVTSQHIPRRAHNREVYVMPKGPLCYLGLDYPLWNTADKFYN